LDSGGGKAVRKPEDSGFEVTSSQVHGQIDRPAPSCALAPIHELLPGYRDHTLRGMPFRLVRTVPTASCPLQYCSQLDSPNQAGLVSDFFKGSKHSQYP
jgi:hypothetical protein